MKIGQLTTHHFMSGLKKKRLNTPMDEYSDHAAIEVLFPADRALHGLMLGWPVVHGFAITCATPIEAGVTEGVDHELAFAFTSDRTCVTTLSSIDQIGDAWKRTELAQFCSSKVNDNPDCVGRVRTL